MGDSSRGQRICRDGEAVGRIASKKLKERAGSKLWRALRLGCSKHQGRTYTQSEDCSSRVLSVCVQVRSRSERLASLICGSTAVFCIIHGTSVQPCARPSLPSSLHRRMDAPGPTSVPLNKFSSCTFPSPSASNVPRYQSCLFISAGISPGGVELAETGRSERWWRRVDPVQGYLPVVHP